MVRETCSEKSWLGLTRRGPVEDPSRTLRGPFGDRGRLRGVGLQERALRLIEETSSLVGSGRWSIKRPGPRQWMPSFVAFSFRKTKGGQQPGRTFVCQSGWRVSCLWDGKALLSCSQFLQLEVFSCPILPVGAELRLALPGDRAWISSPSQPRCRLKRLC